MAYIVDGNNVMGQTPGWHRDKSNSRRQLIMKIAAFAKAKRAHVTIVFDGEPERGVPDGSSVHSVRVLYAERGSDADSRIERLVASSTDPRGLTVVTSDRQLAFAVRSSGASVVRSGEFRKKLDEVLVSSQTREDGEQYDVRDLNGWLRYFGALPEDDSL